MDRIPRERKRTQRILHTIPERTRLTETRRTCYSTTNTETADIQSRRRLSNVAVQMVRQETYQRQTEFTQRKYHGMKKATLCRVALYFLKM